MTLRLPSRLATVQALLLVLAALLAAVVLPRLGPVQPDLLVPFVVAGGLRGGRTTGLLLGLAGVGLAASALPAWQAYRTDVARTLAAG